MSAEKPPMTPGRLFAFCAAAGIGMIFLAIGLGWLGPVIDQNTRVLLLIALVVFIVLGAVAAKKAGSDGH